MSVSLGLLIVRLVVGLLLMGHGTQKLFGWFGGPGFAGAMRNFSSMGFRPSWFWSLLASAGECGGGLLLALGFLNPLGPIIIFADMLMAILKVHWKHGLWGTKGGMEYPLVLLLLSVVLGLVGPGNYSLDTVAKTWYYPKQDTTIHTIEGKQPWAVTIEGKRTHTNRGSSTFFPHEAGEPGDSAVATATPRLRPYRTQA